MTWLVSSLVLGGTVLSACSGQFRRLGRTDVVILTSGIGLNLFNVSIHGRLSLCFKQSVFCNIRALQCWQHLQQGSVDQLVVLLETGSLAVLQYHHYFDRFTVVQELSLAYGVVAADHLGNRLAVSCHGGSLAVAAAKGRIACISTSQGPREATAAVAQHGDSTHGLPLQPHLSAAGTSSSANGLHTAAKQAPLQLSDPVVYAATAPKVAGAVDLSFGLQERMELGDIADLAFFSCSCRLSNSSHEVDGASSLQNGPALDYLAVLSHRRDEDASEVVLFSWNTERRQLCKLGLVTLPHHGNEAVMGWPLHLTAVPSSNTAMVLIGTQAMLVLDFSAILHSKPHPPAVPLVSATVELQGQHLIHNERPAGLHQQRWQGPEQIELQLLLGHCVAAAVGAHDKQQAEPDTGQAYHAPAEDAAVEQPSEQQLQEQQEEQITGLSPENGVLYMADNYEEMLAEGYLTDIGDDEPTTGSGIDAMDEGDHSSEDDHAPFVAAAAAGAVTQQDDLAMITAWTWLTSDMQHKCMQAADAAITAAAEGAAAGASILAKNTAINDLVIATASGSLIKVSLLVESACRNCPASCNNPEQQPCRVYVSKVQQLLQLQSGPAEEVLLSLSNQQLVVAADSRSAIQVLAPASAECGSPSTAAAGAAAGAQCHESINNVLPSSTDAPAAAAAAVTPPYSHSSGPAAGSSLLGSAVGRLHVLMLEPEEQVQQGSSGGGPGTAAAAAMVLDSCSSPAAAEPGGPAVEADNGLHINQADALDSEAACPAAAAAAAAGGPAMEGVGSLQQQELDSADHQQQLGLGCMNQLGVSKSMAYRVVQKLQLLGPVNSFVVAQQQHSMSVQLASAAQLAAPHLGSIPSYPSTFGVPAVVAASSSASGGLRVLTPGTAVQHLQSGPVGMLQGATGMWPVAASPYRTEHLVLVISFTAASRALSVGACLCSDVSDVLGLQTGESTVLAACVGDGVMLQVTPSGARLCCLEEMLYDGSSSSSSGEWQWPGAAKSSRLRQQQPSSSGMGLAGGSDEADTAAASEEGQSAAAAAADTGVGFEHSAAGAAAADGPATTAAACPLQQLQHGTQPSALPAAAESGAAMHGDHSGTAAAADPLDRWLVHASMQQHQQQWKTPTRVVLAAAVAGAAVMHLSSGHLVMLEVSSTQEHKHQQQQQRQEPSLATSAIAMQSDGVSAVTAAAFAPSRSVNRKRHRKQWSVVAVGTLKAEQQVSCLQICSVADCMSTPAAATAEASSTCSSSSSRLGTPFSHYVFAGCYDGSIRMYAAGISISCSSSSWRLQVIHTFNIEQLHPLRLLLKVTAGPSSRAAAAHAVSSAVPDSCLVIPHSSAPHDHGTQVHQPGGADASSGSNGVTLLLMVSYRNGDIALYQLKNVPKQQQHQHQQQAAPCGSGEASAGAAVVHSIPLRVLSQLRVPGAPPKLQLLDAQGPLVQRAAVRASDLPSPDQHVLAVSDRLWVLEVSKHSHQVKLRSLQAPPAVMAVGLQLPAPSSSRQADSALGEQHHSSAPGQHATGDQAAAAAAAEGTDLKQDRQQHLACVLPNGQLQLLAYPVLQQSEHKEVRTWLEGVHVSHIQQHSGSGLLLAACMGPSPSHAPKTDSTGPQPPHVSWLQCLNPSNGARVAAYQPSWGQIITCMGLWAAAAAAFAAGPWPRSDISSSPEQQQQQQLGTGVNGSSRLGLAAAVGALFSRQRSVTTGRTHGVVGGPAQAGGLAGTSGVPDQRFGFADLLRCCSTLEPPAKGSGYRSHSWMLCGTSGHTVYRVGPLVILGTEVADIADQLDGCRGQVIVLRILEYTWPSHAAESGFGATKSTAPVGTAAGPSPAVAAVTDAGHLSEAGAAAATAQHHGYSIQRVARLRMPEPVTALCEFSSDMLLVAAGNVLAVYRIQQDKLQQAAHCFARAPIVSLSVAGHSNGLVMAADMFQGVTAYQVEVQEDTGQVSVKAVAAHTEVRRVKQVACLPPVPMGIRCNKPLNNISSSSTHGRDGMASALGHAHSLGLDSHGHAFEVSWAKERVVPSKTLVTVACMPLGRPAAALHVPERVSASVSSSNSNSEWSMKCVYDLTGNEDIFAHWQDPMAAAAAAPSNSAGQPLTAAAGDAASYAVAATKDGTVSHLQKLPAAEGKVLQHIEQVILQHPLTRALCIGGSHLFKQQQGSNLAGAGLPPCKPPAKLAAVDARVLQVLLLLPLEFQQQVLQEAGLGRVLPSRAGRLLQDPETQQALLDSILCRLQVSPFWE